MLIVTESRSSHLDMFIFQPLILRGKLLGFSLGKAGALDGSYTTKGLQKSHEIHVDVCLAAAKTPAFGLWSPECQQQQQQQQRQQQQQQQQQPQPRSNQKRTWKKHHFDSLIDHQPHKSVLVFSGVLSCLPKSFDAHAWWQDGTWDVYLPIRLCHDPGGEMVEFEGMSSRSWWHFSEHIHINV